MSSDLIWKEAYNVGYFEIDEEHKIFLKTIQKIDEAFLNEESQEYIARLLEELHKYAQFHFISEENIMFKYGYPNLEEHQAEHVALMRKMGSLLITFDPRLINREKLIAFLVDWFKNHTTYSDKKLAQFIMSKNNC
ncbi:MAG: hemerythrin family protein [Prolixibacteraceae bacterium]|nr:hemerythrin family protein [Prolixibacteraceae bacterium]